MSEVKTAVTTVIRVLPHADLCPSGAEFEVQGGTLCDALLGQGVAIEHACEKVGACATCHVHIREGAQNLKPASDEEEDELDKAWGVDPQSRLACQVKVKGERLVVELPRHTRNHAREH